MDRVAEAIKINKKKKKSKNTCHKQTIISRIGTGGCVVFSKTIRPYYFV